MYSIRTGRLRILIKSSAISRYRSRTSEAAMRYVTPSLMPNTSGCTGPCAPLNAGSNASKHRTSFRMSSRTARMISGNDTTDARSMCALQGERHTCIDKRRPGESLAYNRAWRAWLVRRRAVDKRIKDDDTGVVYFEFRPDGSYRGVTYYFAPGSGCGVCT